MSDEWVTLDSRPLDEGDLGYGAAMLAAFGPDVTSTEGPYVHTFTLDTGWASRLDDLQEAWWSANPDVDNPVDIYFGVVHVPDWRWEQA